MADPMTTPIDDLAGITGRCWFCRREVPAASLIAGYDTFEEQRLACNVCDDAIRWMNDHGFVFARSVETHPNTHECPWCKTVHRFDRDETTLADAARSTPVPASNVSKCVACFEPSHDIDHHDHHYHPLDATTYIGEAHPSVPASNVSEGLREAAQRVSDKARVVTRGFSTSPTWVIDDATFSAFRAALAHAAPERLDVERLARAWSNVFAHLEADDWRIARLAAEYARLSQPDATEEAGR